MSDLPDIQKVTALITRDTPRGRDLLVFYRPDDNMTQLPAGTVEDGEDPDDAILREVQEEAGLTAVRVVHKVGVVERRLEEGARVALQTHPLCDEPEGKAGDFPIRRGYTVHLQDQSGDWSRVLYREYDYVSAEQRVVIAWEKVGWLPSRILVARTIRHFYHLTPTEPTPERWTVCDDGDRGRTLELYWTPLDGDPVIVPQQRWWVDQFREQLKGD